jgi:hypothetical protein
MGDQPAARPLLTHRTTQTQNKGTQKLSRHNRVQLIWVLAHEGIAGNETADLLARTGSEPACGISVGVAKKTVRDWMNRNHKKTLGIHNWTQTGKGTYIWALCQNNEGSVEIKQRPIKMDGRTIHRTLSPKRSPFKLRLTDDPTCEKCLKEDESATHILCNCEAIAHLRFHHLGQFFMEPSDYYDAFHSKCRINKGLIKGEAQ